MSMTLSSLNLTSAGSWFQKLKTQLKLSILISEHNPKSVKFYENLTTIMRLRKRQVHSQSNIIHAFSMFRLFYEMWMMAVFVLCLIVLPLESAFTFHEPTHTVHFISTCLNVACICDIIITFRTGYVDAGERKVVMDQRKIAKRYVTSIYFVPDVLSSFPNFYYIFRVEHMTVRFITIFNFLKLLRITTCYDYLISSARYFKVYSPVLIISIRVLVILMICHWSCCGVILLPHLRQAITNEHYNHSWLIEWKLINKSNPDVYVASLYKASGYILCIQHGKVSNLAWEERIFATLCHMGGKLVVFYICVVVVAKFLGRWSLESKYLEIIEELDGFMNRKGLTVALQNRLLQYYNYKFKRTYFEENKIKSFLADRLRHEINAHILQRFTDSVEILSTLNQEILDKIISNLQSEVFLPHDLIIRAGFTGDCMYFLHSGTVAVYSPSGKEVCHLSDGAYFGEIALITKDNKRTAHVIAVEICEVYKLTKRGFNSCLKKNKSVMNKMTQEAAARIEMTQAYEDMYVRDVSALG